MHVPLQALNVFPTDFVVQYVSDLVGGNFLSCGTLVNTIEGIIASEYEDQPLGRPDMGTHPTIVTPIGHGAFPMDRRRYESFAFEYCRFCI